MPNKHQMVMQAVVTPKDELNEDTLPMKLALFNEDGTPVNLSGGGSGTAPVVSQNGELITFTW